MGRGIFSFFRLLFQLLLFYGLILFSKEQMEAPQQQIEATKLNRVVHLQKMLDDQKKELQKKVNKHNENILSKKYRTFKSALQERIRVTDNFIKQAADSFFTMMCDKEYLMLTTEADVIQKVEKFKKNTQNSLQKITQNLESKSLNKGMVEKKLSHQSSGNAGGLEQEEYQQQQQQVVKPKSKSRHKSKNFKISNDASKAMTEWLLRNFENPYPTTQEKLMMAKEGKISMVKVNNWFINARERTVKGYFQREN